MNDVTVDQILPNGIAGFVDDYRAGKVTSLQITQAYLDRIKQLNPKLDAYGYINETGAIATAKAMDELMASGTDLGPLMGVPVAVKDVFNIDGFPAPKAGSKMDLKSLAGDFQAEFITALRNSGVVILGTTKAVEFCLGITGVSEPLGTPWNPYDLENHRVPGGSSSGSGVACGAGLCAFAIGTDSGGSVRVPSAFNGVFGIKTSFGRWPTQGAIPLDFSVDSVGLLTKTAKDAQIAFNAIERNLFGYKHKPYTGTTHLDSLRIGNPTNYFYDDLQAEVKNAVTAANNKLRSLGINFVDIEITEAAERSGYFPLSMPATVMGLIGKQAFEQNKAEMDAIIAQRVQTADHILAADFIAASVKRNQNIENAKRYFNEVDIIACPTTVTTAPLVSEFQDPSKAMEYALGMTRNTQPSNYLGQCAVSIPLKVKSGELPIGYQLIGAPDSDARLLAIAVAIEEGLNNL